MEKILPMNSARPHFEDKIVNDPLDRLVRRALAARVSDRQPPDRVWGRIKRALENEQAPPHRFKTRWSPRLVQAVVTLLLVLIGGAGLHTFLNPVHVRRSTPTPLPYMSMVNVEEPSVTQALVMFDDRAQLRLLKAYPRSRQESQPDTEPAGQPPLAVPRDPTPNVLSPEGRALMAEISLRRLAVEEQSRIHSGPYRWSR